MNLGVFTWNEQTVNWMVWPSALTALTKVLENQDDQKREPSRNLDVCI